VGDDGANPPPAHALARRGIVTNVVGFMVYGDYREANPSAGIINAVVTNGIDVAIAWGPLAGYFAKQSRIPLEISLVAQADSPALPMAFDIACGVRRRDKALREELNNILEHRKTEIEKILDDYAVPRARIAHSMTVQGGSK
jgi:mxaJ protein